MQVPEQRRRAAVGGRIGGDPGLRIRAVDGAVEHGPLMVVERSRSANWRARAAQHDLQQAQQRRHALGEGILLHQALAALGQTGLDDRTVNATLGSVLKYREDQERVRHHGVGELVRAAIKESGDHGKS